MDPCRVTCGVMGEEHPAGRFRLIVGFWSSRLAENLEGLHLMAQTVPQGPSESKLGKLSAYRLVPLKLVHFLPTDANALLLPPGPDLPPVTRQHFMEDFLP